MSTPSGPVQNILPHTGHVSGTPVLQLSQSTASLGNKPLGATVSAGNGFLSARPTPSPIGTNGQLNLTQKENKPALSPSLVPGNVPPLTQVQSASVGPAQPGSNSQESFNKLQAMALKISLIPKENSNCDLQPKISPDHTSTTDSTTQQSVKPQPANVQISQNDKICKNEPTFSFGKPVENVPQGQNGTGSIDTTQSKELNPEVKQATPVAKNAANLTDPSSKFSFGENWNPSNVQMPKFSFSENQSNVQTPASQNSNSSASVESLTAKTQRLNVEPKSVAAEAQKSTNSQNTTAPVNAETAKIPGSEANTSTGPKTNVFAAPGNLVGTTNSSNKSNQNAPSTKTEQPIPPNTTNGSKTMEDPKRADKKVLPDPIPMILNLYGDAFDFSRNWESVSLKSTRLHVEYTKTTISQAQEYFPWIGALHKQGTEIHPHLPYLAMVYNEQGRWDKRHILLLADSEALAEQVKWEIRVALFFRRPTESLRTPLLENLQEIPRSEAHMIIALHTAHVSEEVVLAPVMDSEVFGCNLEDFLQPFAKWMKLMAVSMKQAIADAEDRITYTQWRLRFQGVASFNLWESMTEEERILFTDLVKARVLIYQLENLVPFVSRYTGLIHVHNQRWDSSVKESMEFSPLLECVPLSKDLNTPPSYSKTLHGMQDEILKLFLSSVTLTQDVNGESRTLVLKSVARPDNFLPFEMLYSKEKSLQIASFMNTVTGTLNNAHFTSFPAPKNEAKSFFAIKGIVDACNLSVCSPFLSDPITLSMSQIFHVFEVHLCELHRVKIPQQLSRNRSHIKRAEAKKTAQIDKKTPPSECATQ